MTKTDRIVTTLSHSTGISLGLMIALLAGVFWAGILWRSVEENERHDSKQDIAIDANTRAIQQLAVNQGIQTEILASLRDTVLQGKNQ